MWSESKVKRRGRHWGGLALGANSQPCLPTRRLLTAVVLVVFGLQFARFYLGTPAGRHLCPEQSLGDVADMHAGHNHHAVQEIPPQNPEGGPYFQHCKEYFHGLGLTPVQPLAEPVVLSYARTQAVSIVLLPTLLPFPQSDLATPFHPPRHPF